MSQRKIDFVFRSAQTNNIIWSMKNAISFFVLPAILLLFYSHTQQLVHCMINLAHRY